MVNAIISSLRLKAAVIHLFLTVAIASLVSILVFLYWYPDEYVEISGGINLLKMIIGVDLVCGPLITLVIFNPKKKKLELWRDLTVVAVLQLTLLAYGLHAISAAKPLFLVLEIDRFKVITAPQLEAAALAALPEQLQPKKFSLGPMILSIRPPVDSSERNMVTFESVQGGRDYAERPDFYRSYDSTARSQALARAKPISAFLSNYPGQQSGAARLAAKGKTEISRLKYLPVVARQDWIAVLDEKGEIQGFLKGDGF